MVVRLLRDYETARLNGLSETGGSLLPVPLTASAASRVCCSAAQCSHCEPTLEQVWTLRLTFHPSFHPPPNSELCPVLTCCADQLIMHPLIAKVAQPPPPRAGAGGRRGGHGCEVPNAPMTQATVVNRTTFYHTSLGISQLLRSAHVCAGVERTQRLRGGCGGAHV
jgi:hypothetical protein